MNRALAAGCGLIVGLAAGFVAARWGIPPRPRPGAAAPAAPPTASAVRSNPFTPPAPLAPVEITLTAVVDGSERFVFSGETAWNIHLQWQPPKQVQLNGKPWADLATAPPGWAELARELDLTRARIVARKGRDVISLEPNEDGFEVWFADTPMGSASYAVTIAIPPRATP